jgi:oxazoline/thiazoline synthase
LILCPESSSWAPLKSQGQVDFGTRAGPRSLSQNPALVIEHPRFLPHLRVEALSPDLVFLLHESGHRVLRGRQYHALAPLLNGALSTDQIVDHMAGQLKPAEVYYCVNRLAEQGLIEEWDDSCPFEEAAFWSSQGLVSQQTRARLSEAGVRLCVLGKSDANALALALESLGIATSEEGEGLPVVIVDDYLHPELEAVNTDYLAQDKPWLLFKPNGVKAWLGPLFIPGVTGCWQCLATRLRRNREVETFVAEQKGIPNLSLSSPCLPTTVAQASHQLATEISRYLATGQNAHLQARVLTTDFGTLEFERHTLHRRPDCPACGQPLSAEIEPLQLKERPVRSKEDAGYRACSPQQAWETLKEHVSPITGVVRELTRSDESDGVAPVYLAGHNQAQLSSGYHALREGLRSQSSGKGKTDIQARVSGLCEAIERYSGVFRGGERRRRATFEELGSQAIHPATCLLFSQNQYHRRHELNPSLSGMHFIPRPFDEQERIEWSPLWSLTSSSVKYLPTSFCYYNYQDPESQQCPTCLADSNGNAAGSTLEEAILQGFLELVERDAVALWWYNRLPVSGVDLESLEDPFIDRLNEYYQTLSREYWVLDVTSDLGIPTFAAVSASTAEGPDEILLGFGSHPDPRLAVLRAIEEMNQSLPHLLSWKRGEGEMEAQTDKFWRRATLKRQTYLTPQGVSPSAPRADSGPLDLKKVVERCQAIVEQRGMEFLVLDQTRADIGLPVVKVVVPGLRHFWPRFAPGRLYDAPVEMGRLAAPYAESELNRIPMIL